MSIAENQPIPVREKISGLIMEAAMRVPVEEYVKLRFYSRDIPSDERTAIYLGASAIAKLAEESGKTFRLHEKIQFSADPLIVGARMILARIPLVTYITARHGGLMEEIDRTTRQRDEYELFDKSKLQSANIRLDKLQNDITLTGMVATAAGVIPSSAV